MNIIIVKDFKTFLQVTLNRINKQIKTKNNNKQVRFRDVIYYSSLMIGNKMSYVEVHSHLKGNDMLGVSKKTLVVTKNNIDIKYFERLNSSIVKYIYNNDEPRLIAVDGTHIVLKKSVEGGFSVTKSDRFCTVLISALFDIEREIPINYGVCKHKDERKGLLEQAKYLKENDVLIMDRGYFSFELLDHLVKLLNVKVVFMLRCDLTMLTNLEKTDDITIDLPYQTRTVKFRLIKYEIKKTTYYIGTTVYNVSIDCIKDIYRHRWKIETHFKSSKYKLSLKELKSKNENTVRQDILIHNFVYLVSSFFQYLLQSDIKPDYKINTTNHLNTTVNWLLYLLIYNNATTKTIDDIMKNLNISKEALVAIIDDRHYERRRLTPTSKWCPFGNKYKYQFQLQFGLRRLYRHTNKFGRNFTSINIYDILLSFDSK